MVRPALVGLALLLGGCAPKHDAADAGLRFMMLMKAASGGSTLDSLSGFHETGTVSLGGETRTYETWGDFRALRSVSTTTRGDGASMTNGFDGTVAWQVGPDGAVHRDNRPETLAAARLGAYITVSGYFYPDRFPAAFEYLGRKTADGIAYDVVTVTPEGAGPIDFWLDAENHRLQRLTGQDGDLAFEGVVRRYDVYNGISVPVELTQTIGGETLEHRVLSYDFTEVPAARFSPPDAE
ncbi:MAG TPA: hypothetical protein P5341_10655 [Hyphomonas sp.]|nr:hypothetical protein [Hyphomonas sp.]